MNLSNTHRWLAIVLLVVVFLEWLDTATDWYLFRDEYMILPLAVVAAGIWFFIWGRPKAGEPEEPLEEDHSGNQGGSSIQTSPGHFDKDDQR